MRLFTTSAGNSLGELTSDAAAAGAGVVVDAAAAVEDDAAAGAAGVVAVVVVAGVLGAAAAGFGAGAFLAFINQPNDIWLSVRNGFFHCYHAICTNIFTVFFSHLGNHNHKKIIWFDIATVNLLIIFQYFSRMDQFHTICRKF